MKMSNKSCGALWMSAFLLLGLGLCESAANAASYVVSNTGSSGTGSLRAAIASANGDGVDSVITFDATAFASLQTVLLGGTELGLSNNGKLSITGPTAGVEISGNDTNRVFSVGAGAEVTLSKVTVTRGKSDRGAGINNGGTLTLNNCTITLNQASEYGGGVYSPGTLTVNYCTISGNTATSQYGGGIFNGNDIANANATLTVTGSLFRNNRARFGAGLANQYAATATATNCTFYNNVADDRGAGVDNGGSANLTNCTFVVNTNLSAKSGAGVYGFPGYYIGLTNCLGAQNQPDSFNQYITNNGGNVQASTVGEAGLNSTGLANNGGPTETIALVSRGTAVNAGISSAVSGFPYDQRGGSSYPRIVGGSVDSGAYESNFTPVLVNNTGLTVAVGGSAIITEDMLKATDPVTNPLTYTITSGPSHGTVRLSGNPTNSFTQNDIAAGNVSYTQDGSVAGSDNFVFNAGDGKGGYVTGTFVITIPETRSLVVTTTADTEENDGLISLREAINFANEDGVDSAITFSASVFAAPRKTITLRGEPLYIVGNGTLSITAPLAGVVLDGNRASGVLETQSDAFVTFKSLTITGGNAEQGGGIKNYATLLVDSCTLSGNNGTFGGAIYSENNGTGGSLTIRNSTLSGNSAGYGGGLYNSVGSTSIENCTITGNSAPVNNGAGIICPGDMFSPVTVTVSNSIISGNTGTDMDYEYGNQNSDNIHSGGYNLVGDGYATIYFYENGDIAGNTDPGLALLAENGGPTPTHGLFTDSPVSPALDAGNPAFNGAGQFDQRGSGFPRVQNGRLDIGAFEVTGDSIAPTVVITKPTNAQNLSLPAFTAIMGSATDNVGVTQVQIKFFRTRNGVTTFWNGTSFGAAQTLLNATLASPGVTSTTWSYEVSSALRSALDLGAYSIVAYGKDKGGNTSGAIGRNFNIIADTTAPAPIINTPRQNENVKAPSFTSITGTASDNVGVTQVLIKFFRTRNGVTSFWNGTSFGSTQVQLPAVVASPGATGTSWTFPIDSALKSALDDGAYLIAAYGKDAAGNLSGAVGRNFTLYSDFTLPTAAITSPTQNQSLPIASFNQITGSATDNVGVTQVLIKLFRTRNGVTEFWNGSSFNTTQTLLPVTLASPNATSTTWSYPVSTTLKAALDSGPYLLVAYSKDAVGNQSSAQGRNFTLTKTAPLRDAPSGGSAKAF